MRRIIRGIDTNSHGGNSSHQNNHISHLISATQKHNVISYPFPYSKDYFSIFHDHIPYSTIQPFSFCHSLTIAATGAGEWRLENDDNFLTKTESE
jgi:hypothetical protein